MKPDNQGEGSKSPETAYPKSMGADGATREQAPRRPRQIAFDLLKGIGIVEVLAHHSLGSSARKFSEAGSTEWWTLTLLNRILHFAIPTFLLVSAILLARSLAKNKRLNLKHYAGRRLIRTVWPYLIWSAIYLVFRAFVVRSGFDAYPYSTQIFGFPIEGPRALLAPESLGRDLIWGRAYFHLYFLIVLIQLSILTPAFVWLLRDRKAGFGSIVAVAAAAQLGAFLLQRTWLHAPYPASLAIWYLPSMLIGTWLGLNWTQWPAIWARNRRWFVGAAGVALLPYIAFEWMAIFKLDFFAPFHSVSASIYSTGMALSLLGLATAARPEGRLARGLVAAGALSLPLFVVHPIVMYLMGGPRITNIVAPLIAAALWALLGLCACTWAVTKLLIFLRLDRILFARNFARETAFVQSGLKPPVPTSAVVVVEEG